MSKLNFTPVDEAFTLGSSHIKDTREEIDKLTKLILESNTKPTKKISQNVDNGLSPSNSDNRVDNRGFSTSNSDNRVDNRGFSTSNSDNRVDNRYMRVGYPDNQSAVFRPNNYQQEEAIDYNLMKVIGHPKFDDIVRNYALINHPEWLIKESVYTPQTNKNSISYFGNKYSSTVCSDVRNYIVFFVTCIIIFLFLSLYLK